MIATFASWIILLGLCQAQASMPTTTAVPDSEDPHFIGYYLAPTSTERLTAGQGWQTSGRFAGDCATTASTCVYATGCSDNTLYYDDGSAATCNNGASCVEFTILQSSPDGWPSATNYGCRIGWKAYTVYRQLATTTSSTSISTTSTSTSTTPSHPRSTTTTHSPQKSSDTTVNKPAVKKSNTPIAAIVVPVVVGLLLIGAAAWFFWRRKTKSAMPESQPLSEKPYGGAVPTQYYDQPNHPSELNGLDRPHEMEQPKTYPQVSELPASH
ncbi:hypothetical protein F4808DRAFT_284753 [Astrocystis sublimbata]|nr:hypothetical protein F4808DRAFT_284753 [Astrocystis sublimbata]